MLGEMLRYKCRACLIYASAAKKVFEVRTESHFSFSLSTSFFISEAWKIQISSLLSLFNSLPILPAPCLPFFPSTYFPALSFCFFILHTHTLFHCEHHLSVEKKIHGSLSNVKGERGSLALSLTS